MTQKPGGTGIKGGEIVRALIDLVILALLTIGAGFGGYWYGIHERLAPVQAVAPGTPGALPPTAVVPIPGQAATTTSAAKTAVAPTATTAPTTTTTTHPAAAPDQSAVRKRMKYWIMSSGDDKIGYVITVKVNDSAVDNFFAPGKTVDVTRLIRHGENEVTFEAKKQENYQRHAGQKEKQLILRVVQGTQMQDEFKPADVLVTYRRNAAETEEEYNDTKTFSDGE